MRSVWLLVCIARIIQLYQKYEDIFEQRFSHPVRGMIDAGNDAGIIIVGEMEAHILAQAPLDWSTASKDFYYFASLFYNNALEDNISAAFSVPIRQGKCATLLIEPTTAAYAHNSVDILGAIPNFKIVPILRGVQRQIYEGVCKDSPLASEFGRKKLHISSTAHNTQMLKGIMRRVHFSYDPFGYIARMIHEYDLKKMAVLGGGGMFVTALSPMLLSYFLMYNSTK